jgi:hypothetical protein
MPNSESGSNPSGGFEPKCEGLTKPHIKSMLDYSIPTSRKMAVCRWFSK